MIKERESNKCKRCGRKLKNEESIKLGYGPHCYNKIKEQAEMRRLFRIEKAEFIKDEK